MVVTDYVRVSLRPRSRFAPLAALDALLPQSYRDLRGVLTEEHHYPPSLWP
jgi:hypothetical protein